MPSYATQLTICNQALANILTKPIQTLSDNNERAKMCQLFYDSMRRELIRQCEWTFAKREVTLNLVGQALVNNGLAVTATTGLTIANDPNTQDFNTPWPWAYSYQYPVNCMKLVKVYAQFSGQSVYSDILDQDDNYWWHDFQAANGIKKFEIMRSDVTNELIIGCNLQNAMAKIIFDTTDTSQFDELFVTALTYKIAQRICLPLTGDKELKAQIDQDLERVMTDAFRINLGEYPTYGPKTSSFERSRGIS